MLNVALFDGTLSVNRSNNQEVPNMKKKKDRDLEKTYPKGQFIAKLRRLADTLEAGKNFSIQISGERLYVPSSAIVNIEHEREGQWEEVEFQIKWKKA
jgi:amphi-Trp domain-containing protein